tara:strand:- start:41 stop:274 length:234 start_codon:yes stop_codon:yes gene_type:complete
MVIKMTQRRDERVRWILNQIKGEESNDILNAMRFSCVLYLGEDEIEDNKDKYWTAIRIIGSRHGYSHWPVWKKGWKP